VAAWLRRILTLILVIVLAVVGLATLDNALAPAVQLSSVTHGPPALSVVRALEVDEKASMLYAGSNAGVFKSSDGGMIWLPASNGMPGVDVQDLLFDRRTNTLYAVLFGVGLYRSSDGAQTWQPAGQGMRGSELLTLALDERDGLMVAGLRGYGFYTSLDNGQSWQTGGMGLTNMNLRALLPGRQPGELFAASEQGVFRSLQITTTWQSLTEREDEPPVSARSLALDTATGVLYAGTDQGMLKFEPEGDGYRMAEAGLTGESVQAVVLGTQPGVLYAGTLSGVYLTADGGATWSAASAGLGSTLVRALLLMDQGAALLAGTDSGVYRSTDEGATWQPAAQSPLARHAQALLVDEDGSLYAGTLGGGVFHSTDAGATWQPFSAGLRRTVIQSLAVDHGAGALYAATPQGVYRSSLGVAAWRLVGGRLEGEDVLSLSVDERRGTVYAVTANGDMFRSATAGTQWEQVQPSPGELPAGAFAARSADASSYSGAVYAGAYKGGVLQSLDGGFNWQQIGGDLPDLNVEVLMVDERNGTLYAGTLGGSVFRKLDDQSGWEQVGQSLPGNIVSLAVEGQGGALLAGLKAGLFSLAEGEQTWQPATSGMSHTSILALATHASSGTSYAGTVAGGVFRSVDSGQTWHAASGQDAANASLNDTDMRSIVADDASRALVVGTTGRGVFRADDGGAAWRVANAGLHELTSLSLAADRQGGALSLITQGGEYHSTDGAATWQSGTGGAANLLDLILTGNAFGFAGRLPSGELLWATSGGGSMWAHTAANLGLINATITTDQRAVAVWGTGLTQTEPGVATTRVPLAWLLVRAWVWSGWNWLALHVPGWWLLVLAVILLALLAAVMSRVRLSSRFSVPLPVALLTPGRSLRYASPRALDAAWPRWERLVQSQLYSYGEVRPIDLPRVPAPFRLYAMQRFAENHADQKSVRLEGKRLVASARIQMGRWMSAWQAIKDELRGQHLGWEQRKRTDQLADAFATALSLRASAPHDVESVRAYATAPVGAGASTGLPAPVALLFVADNEALSRTLQSLTTALNEVSGEQAIGLVIPLGRPGRDVDMVSQVRGAVAESEHERRLVVLNDTDVLDIMAAHDPVQALNTTLAAARAVALAKTQSR
jgi:ligand-binding sensor domain-containing protein